MKNVTITLSEEQAVQLYFIVGATVKDYEKILKDESLDEETREAFKDSFQSVVTIRKIIEDKVKA